MGPGLYEVRAVGTAVPPLVVKVRSADGVAGHTPGGRVSPAQETQPWALGLGRGAGAPTLK